MFASTTDTSQHSVSEVSVSHGAMRSQHYAKALLRRIGAMCADTTEAHIYRLCARAVQRIPPNPYIMQKHCSRCAQNMRLHAVAPTSGLEITWWKLLSLAPVIDGIRK